METIRKPKIYAAIIVFVAVILMIIFVAAPIQAALGIWGLLLTEVIIAVFALVPVFLLRYDIREVIPVRRPMVRQVYGVLLLWISALLVGYLGVFIAMFLFPDKMMELSKALGGFMTDAPFLLSLVIGAVMPAICEEMLCRGFIQYSLGGLKSKWLIILFVGVLFGVFHLSPFRFFPTMVLGFALAYIMIETRNIILPMILHFVNNGLSLVMSYATGSADVQADPAMLSKAAVITIGIILLVCTVVPWLCVAGARLLHPKAENRQRPTKNKQLLAAGIISGLCVIGGFVTLAAGASNLMGDLKVLDMSYTETVSADGSKPDTFPVAIKEDGNYQLSYVITSATGADGTTHISLKDAGGTEYLGLTAGSVFGNTQKFLAAGDYTLTYEYDYKNTAPSTVQVNLIIIKVPG